MSGEFPPGAPLPRRHELLSHYKASNVTVQRAVNQLTEEGFIESRGSKGIYVSLTPPHKFRFAVVIPPDHREQGVNGDTQWEALEKATVEIRRDAPEYTFEFYNIGDGPDIGQPDFRRLLRDLGYGLSAGVILAAPLDRPLLEKLRPFPAVSHDPKYEGSIPGTVMKYDYVAMARMAVARLAERGASKIAVLLAARTNLLLVSRIEQAIQEAAGVTTRPEWIQGVHHQPPQSAVWVSRIIRLLYAPGMPETPDGLLVLNENLLPHIMNTLSVTGQLPGRSPLIVSHCNTPSVRPFYPEVEYLTFNAVNLLRRSISLLQRPSGQPDAVEWIAPEHI